MLNHCLALLLLVLSQKVTFPLSVSSGISVVKITTELTENTEIGHKTLQVSCSPIAPPAIGVDNPVQTEKHTLILYYAKYCPYSQSVLKYLKGIHKQVPMKNLADNAAFKEELKRIGGKMQVPCLVIDGKALYESNEIIKWLSQHQDELEPINKDLAK